MIKITIATCSECEEINEGIKWSPKWWQFWKQRIFLCQKCISKAFRKLGKDKQMEFENDASSWVEDNVTETEEGTTLEEQDEIHA